MKICSVYARRNMVLGEVGLLGEFATSPLYLQVYNQIRLGKKPFAMAELTRYSKSEIHLRTFNEIRHYKCHVLVNQRIKGM